MGFRLLDPCPRTLWMPIDGTDTLYVGQLVYHTGDGLANLGQASGAADTSGKKVPFGIVIGNNDAVPTYDSTYLGHSISGLQTQAGLVARSPEGVEGPWSKGDHMPFVNVALIEPHSVIEGPLYNAALGTAPTVVTVTTGSATGLGFTSGACDFTPVADLCTSYCRSGANAGLYRISDDTSTTVETNDTPFDNDIAVGDTFVRVPLRFGGESYVQTDSEALYFDVSASPATNYWVIRVIKLDLRNAGHETVQFQFGMDHFCLARA